MAIPHEILFDCVEEGVADAYAASKADAFQGNTLHSYMSNDIHHFLHTSDTTLSLSNYAATLSSLTFKVSIKQILFDDCSGFARTLTTIEHVAINSNNTITSDDSLVNVEAYHVSTHARLKDHVAVSTTNNTLLIWDLNHEM